jgi:hypothetical protein
VAETIEIGARFNGPDGSGNGGYVCGVVANAVGSGPAEVSLHAPPPLERPLAIVRSADGAVSVSDGETLVATGRPATVQAEPPPAVAFEAAAAASKAGFDQWKRAHPFPRCFVCGPDRGPGDGFEIFPGPLDGDGTFAATWVPEGEPGSVVPAELVWAALDCPTSAPAVEFGAGNPCVLARLTAVIDGEVRAGEPHVLLSWREARDGRKRRSAVALYDGEGMVTARADALWIELKER